MNRREKADRKKSKHVDRLGQRRGVLRPQRYAIYASKNHPLRKGHFTTTGLPRMPCGSCGKPAVYAVTLSLTPRDADFRFACRACPDKVLDGLRVTRLVEEW